MKQLILLFCTVCLSVSFALAQQIDRKFVVIEITTGTWCGFCPGAAMAADDMVHNGHKAAIIENHGGDSHESPASSARNNYYGVSGYPSSFFDGGDEIVGGNATQSMYQSFLPKFNTRMSTKTSFDINVEFSNTGLNYEAEVTVTNVAAYPNLNNLILHLAVTESHIPDNWLNNLTEVNFVNRMMVPSANGTPLDFSSQTTHTLNLNFTASGTWNTDNCEIVAFLQDPTTKEILNGDKRSLAVPAFPNDAMVAAILKPDDDTYCERFGFTPEVSIRNRGSNPLTSLDIEYWYNAEPKNFFQWTGNLPFNQLENIPLPNVSFTSLTFNKLNVKVRNPNGVPDEDPSNDLLVKQFERPIGGPGTYEFVMQPDDMGANISWYVYDWNNGTLPAQGGPYTNGDLTMIRQNFTQTSNGCISLVMKDAGDDGLCVSNSPGWFAIVAPSGDTVLKRCHFGTESFFHFTVGTPPTDVDDLSELSFEVFPNPTNGLMEVNLELLEPTEVDITLHQLDGKQVMNRAMGLQTGSFAHQFDMSAHPKGVYLLMVKAGEQVLTEKVVRY